MQNTPEEILAIEKFALSVTLPILLELRDGVGLLATGTLFKVGPQHFLVTARHVFDGVWELEKLAYPEAPKGGGTHTFGACVILKPDDENIDVAVILLNDPTTVERLTRSWQFLSLKNIAEPVTNAPDGHFFVAGYPNSLTKPVNGWLSGKFVTAYTQRIPEAPEDAERPVSSELDLFFDYGKIAISVAGTEIATPELPGVSGASVWQARKVNGPIWSPELAFSVIGVQSSYKHSKYIRAKSWWAVAKVLEEIDATLADVVRTELGTTKLNCKKLCQNEKQ